MGKIAEMIRSPLTFLFARSRNEDLVAEHVIREHHRGRALADILNDAYITNRLTPDKVERVLERPDVIRAVGDDLASQRATSGG
jgi:hypothetical protein